MGSSPDYVLGGPPLQIDHLDLRFLGVDNGDSNPRPHLGNFSALVSCISLSLDTGPELRIRVSLVSSISPPVEGEALAAVTPISRGKSRERRPRSPIPPRGPASQLLR